MSEQPPSPGPWSVSALVISVLGSGLLGLSAGRTIDALVRPTLGEGGAAAVGFTTAAIVAVLLAVVVYRGLTRKG